MSKTKTTRVQDILAAAGYVSQSQLARKLEVGEAQVSQWFNGKRQPNEENRKKLTRKLGPEAVEELWPNG